MRPILELENSSLLWCFFFLVPHARVSIYLLDALFFCATSVLECINAFSSLSINAISYDWMEKKIFMNIFSFRWNILWWCHRKYFYSSRLMSSIERHDSKAFSIVSGPWLYQKYQVRGSSNGPGNNFWENFGAPCMSFFVEECTTLRIILKC